MIQVPSPGSGGGGGHGGGGGGGPGGGGGGTSPRSNNNKYDRLRRKSLAFLASLFRLRKRSNCLIAGMRIAEETKSMQRSPRLDNPALATGSLVGGCRPRSAASQHQPQQQNHHQHQHHHHQQHHQQQHQEPDEMEGPNGVSRIPSTLSVAAVDVVLACRQAASPSHSILTLTPGRTRNIDQDMEALRLSRQDNPFLQVLASKESLIEPVEESESDDAILMSQEFGDTDPLTLAQVHEHLVRSPPPASWSRTPMFHFPHQQQQQQDSPGSRSEPTQQQQHRAAATSPKSMLHRDDQPKSEGSMEIRDRHSHTFSLLNPTPIRSLSEVRRLHRSAEDSVQLMSSES